VVAAEGAAEKEKAQKDENREERLIFYQLYTRFFFLLQSLNLVLFIGVEEGNLVFAGEKFPTLDLTLRI